MPNPHGALLSVPETPEVPQAPEWIVGTTSDSELPDKLLELQPTVEECQVPDSGRPLCLPAPYSTPAPLTMMSSPPSSPCKASPGFHAALMQLLYIHEEELARLRHHLGAQADDLGTVVGVTSTGSIGKSSEGLQGDAISGITVHEQSGFSPQPTQSHPPTHITSSTILASNGLPHHLHYFHPDMPRLDPAGTSPIAVNSTMISELAMGAVRTSQRNFRLRKAWQEHKAQGTLSRMQKKDPGRTSLAVDSLFESSSRKVHEESKPRLLGSKRSRWIIHPGSSKRALWDLVSMVLLFWDCLTIPFILAFEPPPSQGLRNVTITTMLFWTIDIPLAFLTGFQLNKKEVMMQPSSIARHYICTFFFIDVTVVFIDWFLVLGDSGQGGSAARLGRSIRILKLLKTLKLLRAMKLKKYIQAVQDLITSEAVSIWFGIIQVLIGLLVVNHIAACIWYVIGDTSCCQKGDTSCSCEAGWVEVKLMLQKPLSYRYATALHWSFAQFTPAPNEIFPQNFVERTFATAVLMVALICFSAFTGTVTAGIMQLRKMSGERSKAFWQLRRYLREWQVPQKFRRRVVAYLEFAYEQQRKRIQEKDVTLLTLLSDQLQFELRRMTLKEHLHGHPLFFRLHYATQSFIKALETRNLAAGDNCMKCGEQASDMLFVIHGQLQYTKPFLGEQAEREAPSKYEIRHVDYGDWVCEPVLWIDNWIHLGHVSAKKECTIITIAGKEFGKSMQKNVDLWTRVQVYANRYLQELNQLEQESLSDLLVQELNPDAWEDGIDIVLPPPHIASSMDMGMNFWDSFHDVAPKWLSRCVGHMDKRKAYQYGANQTHHSWISSA